MQENPSETDSGAVAYNPASGQVHATHPWTDESQVDACFHQARAAQLDWADLSVRERARRIRPFSQWLEQEADRLATVISTCNGKTQLDAMTMEVLPAAKATHHYCRMAPSWLAEHRPTRSSLAFLHKRTRVHRMPHGLVGIIAPWNYPLGIPVHDIIAALLAGNGVLFKAAPETVPVAEAMAEGIEGLDLPEGLFHHLILPGPATGERFLRSEDGVDKLSFTGSVAVGRLLARQAAENLIPLTLELGGKDPMLVCEDAPMPRTANGALWAGLQNTGQACAGVERIYAHEAVYPDLVASLAEGMQQLRVGPPDDPDSDLGPMTSLRQRDSVQAQIDEALDQGAHIAAQAEIHADADPRGFYLAPTLLTNVSEDMRIMREETFGPVITVSPVADMDEAIRRANALPYALTASVWTRSRRRGRALAARVRAGTVMINDHMMAHAMSEVSWGGPGASGLGRSHGRTGMLSMTWEQNRVDDRLHRTPRALWWYPYDARLQAGLKGALSLFHARGLGRRLRGGLRFLGQFPRIFKSPWVSRKR